MSEHVVSEYDSKETEKEAKLSEKSQMTV